MTSRHTEQRRARAAAAVAEQRRRERRRRSAIVAGGVALAVALLVAVGVAVQSHRTATSSSGATPAAATAQGGFTSGAATARASVVVYEDFQCPVCRQFEQDAGSALDALVQQGVVRAEWRPIAILDRASTSQYSTRAASAAACAADAGDFRRYAEALFREQPPEGGAGLSDRRLVDLGREIGLTSSDFASCVTGHRYTGWAARATDAASRAGVTATPTVLVNGQPLADRTAEGLRAAVARSASR